MNRIVVTLVLAAIAILMAVPMIRCLGGRRAIIRSMAIASLVIDALWWIGALLVVWSSSLGIILGLAQITLSLFAMAFMAAIVLPLIAAKNRLNNAARISTRVTIGLAAITYLDALGLIWAGETFLLFITGPLMLVSLALTIILISIKTKNNAP